MSDDSPFHAPDSQPRKNGRKSHKKKLRQVASAQRHANMAAGLYLLLIPVNIAISSMPEPILALAIGFLVFALGILIFGAISVFRLQTALNGFVLGTILGVLTLVPLLGLILLLLGSQKATILLKENGIAVGLLGADPNSI